MGDIIKEECSKMSDEIKENCIETESQNLPEVENLLKTPELQDYYKGKYSTYLSKDYSTRFYTDRYSVDFKNISEQCKDQYFDILVRIHTNGLLLIALAPGNSIMQSSKEISEINFKINKTDRSYLAIKGKKKYGAKCIKKGTTICQVKLEGDPVYHSIKAGVCGNLIEYNELIKTRPNIMKTDPKGLGYICVLINRTKGKETEIIDNLGLITEDQYFEDLSKRGKFWKKETTTS